MEIRLRDRRTEGYRWHLMRTAPARNVAGELTRWYGTATDLNEQRRGAEADHFLAEVSAALATLVDYKSTLEKVVNLAVPNFAEWSAVDLADDAGWLRRVAIAHRDPEKVRLVREISDTTPQRRARSGVPCASSAAGGRKSSRTSPTRCWPGRPGTRRTWG
jgi:hypothetical protein